MGVFRLATILRDAFACPATTHEEFSGDEVTPAHAVR